MANNKLGMGTRGITVLGGLVVGDPSSNATTGALMTIKRINQGTFVANTSSVPQSSIETQTFTLTGATTGDLVFVQASTLLDTGLTLNPMGIVTATSTVTVSFINETSAAVVQTSGLTNKFFFIDIT